MEWLRQPEHCTLTCGSVDNMLNICIRGKHLAKYPAKTHARRVAETLHLHNHNHHHRHRHHAEDGLIVLAATQAGNWPNSDMPAPFRQDRYFYYMTGCNEPDCLVSYDIETDTLTLWLPPIDKDRVLWYGRGSTVEEALEKYDVDDARYLSAGKAASGDVHDHFGDAVERSRSAGAPHQSCHRCPAQRTRDSELEEANPQSQYALCQSCSSAYNALYQAIDACRVIKDEHEIDLIRRANAITAEAHVNVMKRIHAFVNEAEVEAAYMQVCIARKAKVQAYDVIAASGPNAAELHYSENVADFRNGQTVVLDAGCEVECYASDVTRTLPINRKNPGHWPSEETADIYSLVERIQESCIRRMLPGSKFIELFWLAHQMVVEGLLELGIFKGGSVEEIFSTGTSQAFLPHGLGHHVGLEVHDVSPVPHPPFLPQQVRTRELDCVTEGRPQKAFAAWKPQCSPSFLVGQWAQAVVSAHESQHSCTFSDAAVLEPDMVVTVEPGIYFNQYLLDNFFLNKKEHRQYIDLEVLQRYMQVGGVRIEDDILITKDGYENLTTAPKGEEMLKLIRKSAMESVA